MADDEKDQQKDAVAPATPPAAGTAAEASPDTQDSQPVDPTKPVMDIKVYAPFKIYYEGKGYSISGTNETGPFDILPHHHNFLCMILPGNLVIRTPYDTKTVKVSRALMHVKADKVTVFVDV